MQNILQQTRRLVLSPEKHGLNPPKTMIAFPRALESLKKRNRSAEEFVPFLRDNDARPFHILINFTLGNAE